MVYYGTVNRLKYEFIVHPGADPSKVRLAYRGAEKVFIDREGRLQVNTPGGSFSDDLPIAYQRVGGRNVSVPLAYRLETLKQGEASRVFQRSRLNGQGSEPKSKNSPGEEAEAQTWAYGFKVGAYDRSQTLVLDPAFLIYCGYIGGQGIAVDSAGNAYIAGATSLSESTFPVTVGPDVTYNGSGDAFVAKVNSSGTALVYCGYIGGDNDDGGFGIAVDGSGSAYVTGDTSSTEATFPRTVGPDLTQNGSSDAFVAKVNPSGTGLVYCGYIGGSDWDWGHGIAVDGSGCAYVAGETSSAEATFPVTVGPDLTFNDSWTAMGDAFVAKVNSSGTGLVYCGYVGGSATECGGTGIAVDSAGNAYISGMTGSGEATFPVTVGPDLTYDGSTDAFVAKVNSTGTGLVYCGYIGGSGYDWGNGIAVDGAGYAYVAGWTDSTSVNYDAFVAKVNVPGTALVYYGCIGGSGEDRGVGIAADTSGYAYVTGFTRSSESTFPVTGGPDVTFNGGYRDAFVAKVNASGTGHIYCGYIGGSGDDSGLGITVDSSGNVYITGSTDSIESTFPVTVGPDLTQNGVFIAKIGYFDERVPKHAVGDLDGDSTEEVAVDFGGIGAWIYDSGNWTPLTVLNPLEHARCGCQWGRRGGNPPEFRPERPVDRGRRRGEWNQHQERGEHGCRGYRCRRCR